MMLRSLMAGFAGLLFATQAYCADVTKITVGFPPGQATDFIARILADRMSSLLNETVIVENRPGVGGSIALASLKTSPADGHTMVLAPLASLVVNPHMYKTVGYETLTDFAPVALVTDLPLVLVVNPSVPAKNVAELVAYAKANPGKLSNPSSGNGTLSHLGMEVFKQDAGLKILHVPYRGSPPAMTDLMTDIVQVAMDTVAVTEPFIRAGKMRLLASAYGSRLPEFPDTPTLAELGYKDINLAAWLGIVVPKGTPKERIDQLGKVIKQIVDDPDIKEKFRKLGAIPHAMSPEEFGRYLVSQDKEWSEVVKKSGVSVH